MKTAIVTDSNSGITQEEARLSGVFVVPMPVLIDSKQYFEGVTLSQEQFYQKLRDGQGQRLHIPAQPVRRRRALDGNSQNPRRIGAHTHVKRSVGNVLHPLPSRA